MQRLLLIVNLLVWPLAGADTLLILHKNGNSLGYYDPGSGKKLASVPVGEKPHEMELSADGRLLYVTLYGVDRWTDTAAGGNSITVVDIAARKAVGAIDLGKFHRPHGIVRARSGLLYVTADQPPSLVAVDPRLRKVVRNYDIGQSAPHMVAVLADESKAFVANSGSGTVSVIQLKTGSVRHINVGGIPMGLAFCPSEMRVYAACRTNNKVVEIETASEKISRTLEIAGHPVRLKLLPGDERMLISLIDSGEAAVFEMATLKVLKRFPVGTHAEGIGVDPAGGAGYASAQDDNRVMKFSLRDYTKLLDIATEARPDPILVIRDSKPAAPQADLAVLHKGGSSLGFYSAEGKLLSSVATGRHPHEFVRSPDRRYLYITDNGTMRIEEAGKGGNTVSIIDLDTRKKVGEISLGSFHRPHGIDIIRQTGQLLVSTELPDQLLLVDLKARKVIRTFDAKGKTTHMVTASADGKWAFASNSSSASVAAIELATGKVKLIQVGERPEGSVLSKDGKLLFVACREAHHVAMIDTAKQELAGTIAAGKGPVRIAITPDGRTVVYACLHDNTVEFIDVASRKVTARIPVKPPAGRLVSLTLSPDGKLAYTSAEDDDRVFVVSVPDKKVVGEFRTAKGMGPDPVMELR